MKNKKITRKPIFITIILIMVFLPLLQAQSESNIDILNISVTGLDGKIAQIKWSTNIITSGRIIFGEKKNNLDLFIIDGKSPSRYHEIILGNLKAETIYYFKIFAYNNDGQINSFLKSFKTKKFNDGLRPIINDFKIAHISGTAAVVTWETNEKSSSRVEYGTGHNYRTKAGNGTKVINHTVAVKNLKLNTKYFLRVYSVDKDNNKSSFASRNFTTRSSDKADKEKFKISYLRPSSVNDTNISKNSVEISFKTNHASKGSITLNKRGRKPQKKILTFNTNHSAIFLGLLSNSIYNVNISIKDIFGKTKREKFKIKTKESSVIIIKNEVRKKEEKKENNITVLGEEFFYYSPQVALYKTNDSASVYAIVSRQRHAIASTDSFIEYGYNWIDIKIITKESLLKYPRAKLVKNPEDNIIYYLYKMPDNKILKIKIPSPDVFNSYKSNSWENIMRITSYDIEFYGDVKLIKTADHPDVYYLENGTKRYVSEEVFKNKKFSIIEIAEVNQAHLDSFQPGNPLN